jgi:hypothetical protein
MEWQARTEWKLAKKDSREEEALVEATALNEAM